MSEVTRSWSIARENGGTYKYTYMENDGLNVLTLEITGLKTGTPGNYSNLEKEAIPSELAGVLYWQDYANKVVGVNSSQLSDTSNIALTTTNADNAKLYLDTSDKNIITENSDGVEQKYKWVVDANGKAEYKFYKYGYHKLDSEGKTISYVTESTAGASTVVAEISKLKDVTAGIYKEAEMENKGVSVEKDALGYNTGVITLSEGVLGKTADETLKVEDQSEDYELSIGGISKVIKYTVALSGATDGKLGGIENWSWSVADADGVGAGTSYAATYTKTTSEFWQVLAGASEITYSASATASLMSVTGLSNTATAADLTVGKGTQTYVTLADNAIGSTSIALRTLGDASAYDAYTLKFATDHSQTVQTAGFSSFVTAADGTSSATYAQTTTAGFSFADGNKTANYIDASTYNFFSISGISSFEGIDVAAAKNADSKYVITLNQSALSGVNVTLTDSKSDDDYDYELSLNNVQSVTEGSNYWGTSAVGSASTTITLKYDTTQGWALSGTSSVLYSVAQTGLSRAVITGLSSVLNLGSDSKIITGIVVSEDGTITLDKVVLGSQSIKITDDVDDGTGYKLALKEDYSVKDEPIYFMSSVSGTSSAVTYQFDQTEGWALSGTSEVLYTARHEHNNLFTITGLSANFSKTSVEGAAGKYSDAAGITVDHSTSEIILTDDVLVKDATVVVSLSSAEGYGYKFADFQAFTAASAVDTTLTDTDFATDASLGHHWEISTAAGGTSSTAVWLYNSFAGYSLAGNSITYMPTTGHSYFTITGLSADLDRATFMSGITFHEATEGESTITLSRTVLAKNTAVNVSIEDGTEQDNVTYSLALDADATIGSVSDASLVAKSGQAYVRGKLTDYYTLTSGSISYIDTTAAKDIVQIDGIKVSSGMVQGASISGTTITLTKDAFKQAGVSFLTKQVGRNGVENVFSFALSGGISSNQIYEYGKEVWTVDGVSGAAAYQMGISAGYTLNDGDQSITYSTASVGTAVFMTLEGISSQATAGDITIKDNTVYLGKGAISQATITLDIKPSADYSSYFTDYDFDKFGSYSLAFLNGDSLPSTGASYFSIESIEAGGGNNPEHASITYKQYTSAGFSFTDEAHRVATYSGESTVQFFALSGIANVFETTEATDRTKTSLDGIEIADDGVITLNKSVLAKRDVVLENETGFNYSLSLAGDYGVASLDSYFAKEKIGSESTTATLQYNTTEGWDVDGGLSKIIYTGASAGLSRAVITGLAKDLQLNSDSSIAGITFSGSSGNYTITLEKAVLGGYSINLQDDVYDNIHYSLALKDPASYNVQRGKEYFATVDGGGASTTATYQFDLSEGWRINGTSKIDHIAKDPNQVLFKLEGLSGGIGLAGQSLITGINVAQTGGVSGTYEIKLSANILGSQSVYLTDLNDDDRIDFSLSLAEDVKKVTRSEEYFGVSSVAGESTTTATYQFDLSDGFEVADGAYSVASYIGERKNQGLFSLSGLSGGITLAGQSLITGINVAQTGGSSGDYTITLDKSVLAGQSVYLTDLKTNAEDDGINFSLSLAEDVRQSQELSYDFAVNNDGTSSAVTYQLNKTDAWNVVGDSVMYTGQSLSSALFTLEGLSNGLTTGTLSALAGISVTEINLGGDSKNYIVTLDNSVLGGMSVKLTDSNKDDNYYFSLSLASNVDAPSTVDVTNHWDIVTVEGGTSSTAIYRYFSQAGYSIVGDSAVYFAEKEHKFITITGLSAGLSAAALSKGITFAEGTSAITLTRSVLNGQTVSITDDDSLDGANYFLALDDNATVGTIKNAALSAGDNGIMGYRGDYYSLNGTSQVTYTGASSSFKLVGISGVSIADGTFTGTSLSGNTIILSASAFTKAAVSLSNNYNTTYSLSIAGADAGNLNDYGDNYWTVNGGTAKYEQEVFIGYTLQDDKQSVSYSTEKLAPNEFMTVTGLSTGATSSAISFLTAGGTSYVVLQDAAIGSASIFLIAGNSAYNNYSLSFANFGEHSLKQSSEYWSVNGTSYTYNQDTNAGFLPISGKSAFYVGLSTANFFTITGLSEGLTDNQTEIKDSNVNDGKYANLAGVAIDNSTHKITVDDNALLAGQSVSITDGASYTFILSTTKTPDTLDTSKGDGGNYWTAGATSGAFILKNDTKDGFVIGANSRAINYVGVSTAEVASIAGLSTAVTVGENGYLYLDSSSISAEFSVAGGSTFFYLKDDAMLGESSVTITGNNYYLAVDTDSIKAPEVKENDKYWIGSTSGAITYRYDTTAGYSLAESGKVLEYSPLKHNDELTITGLSSSIVEEINASAEHYISFRDGLGITLVGGDNVVSLDSRALAGASVSMSGDSKYTFYLSTYDENDGYYNRYKAGIDYTGDDENDHHIATKARESYTITTATTAATVKALNEAYYTLLDSDSRTITYTKASIGSALATITGLSKGFKAEDLTVGLYVAAISGVSGVNDTPAVDGVITLSEKALGTSDITLKLPTNSKENYKLALNDGIEAPTLNNEEWTVTGAGTKTATYTAKVTAAGYTVSLDGKTVRYTAAGDNKVLFKITGLSSTAVADSLEVNNGTVKLKANALGTSTIKFTTNELNYKFVLGEGIQDKAVYANVWRVEGTTATFKQVILGYNEINDKNEVIYHAEQNVKDKEYAKITGLTGTFRTDDTNGKLYLVNENKTKTEVLSITSTDSSFTFGTLSAAYDPDKDTSKAGGTITILDGEALSQNSQVKLTGLNGASYAFDLEDNIKPEVESGSETWEVSGTTAYYKAGVSAGFKLTDATTIQYVSAGEMTLASITGLNADITVDSVGAAGNKLGYMDDETFTEGVDVDKSSSYTFTFNNDAMLGLSNASLSAETVTGTNYSLGIGDSVSTSIVLEAKKWVISGPSASYANYKPTYYTLKDNGNLIECTPATQIGNTIATISGLSTAVTVNANGTITGLEIDESAKKITLDKGVLGTSSVSAGQYYLYTEADVDTVATNDYVMTFEGGTATVKQTPSAYYTGNGTKTLTYHAAGSVSTATTITGLIDGLAIVSASGRDNVKLTLKTDVDATGNAVEIDTKAKKVKIYEAALKDGEEDYQPLVKVTEDYTIALDEGVIALQPKTQDNNSKDYQIWTIDTDKGTATLSKGQTAGYSLSTDGKELTYSEAQAVKDAPAIVTIKGDGLKKIELGNGDGNNYLNTIDGVTVDETNRTVTVTKDFLTTTNSDIEVSDGYTLAITGAQNNNFGFGNVTPTVDYKNGTITFTATTDAGWILDSNSKKITYYAPEKTNTTLSGLNTIKNVEFSIKDVDNKTYVGYTVDGGTFTKVLEVTARELNPNGTLKASGTLKLVNSGILKTSDATFTLSSARDYDFAFGTDDKLISNPQPVWSLNSKNALIYANDVAAGTYTLADKTKDSDGNVTVKTITYNKKSAAETSPIVTLTGLDKSIFTVATDGTITDIKGITVDSTGTPPTVTLSRDLLGKALTADNAKVTLTNGKGNSYVLATDAAEPADSKNYWDVSATDGKATYKYTTSDGYTPDDKKVTLTHTTSKDTVYFELSGLNKNSDIVKNFATVETPSTLTEDQDFEAVDLNKTADGTYSVTLKDTDALDKTANAKVTLTTKNGKKHTLGIVEALGISAVDEAWQKTNDTTAELKSGKSEGYEAKGTTATYKAAELKTTIAKITGLPSTIKEDDLEKYIGIGKSTDDTYTFTLSNELLDPKTTTKIVATKGSAKDVKLALEDSENAAKPSEDWSIDSGKATCVRGYKKEDAAGYVLSSDGKTLSYVDENTAGTTVLTITGLDKTFKVPDDEEAENYITYDGKTKTVTLDDAVLGTSNITIACTEDKNKTSEYKVTASAEKMNDKAKDFLSVSGTTATYGNGTAAHFKQKDSQTLTYMKEKMSKKYFTISGIKKGATNKDIDIDEATGTITIEKDALAGKNITLKKGTKDISGYKFELGTGIDTSTATPVYKSGSYTLTPTAKTYNVSSDGKTIVYSGDNPKSTLLYQIKNAPGVDTDVTTTGKEVTLTADALKKGTKTITLTDKSKEGYGFVNKGGIAEDSVKPALSSENVTVTEKSGTGTLNGSVSDAGFYFTDSTTLTYVKKGTFKATIKGLNKSKTANTLTNTTLNADSRTITVATSDVSDAKKVTVDGGGVVGFSFDANLGTKSKTATIAGSAKNDTITALSGYVSIDGGAGSDHITATGTSKVTVTGGKGNDYITVNGGASVYGNEGNDVIDLSGTNNTFYYKLKDGDDVITGFDTTDKISLSGGASVTTVTASGSDVVISLADSKGKNPGTITLEGMVGTDFYIGTTKYKVTASNDGLLYSDNYGTSADLGELTKESSDYSVGEIETSNNTSLTKDQPQLTFGKK